MPLNISDKGNGCGEVGRAEASSTKDPRFESSHQRLYLLSTVPQRRK